MSGEIRTGLRKGHDKGGDRPHVKVGQDSGGVRSHIRVCQNRSRARPHARVGGDRRGAKSQVKLGQDNRTAGQVSCQGRSGQRHSQSCDVLGHGKGATGHLSGKVRTGRAQAP